MKSGYIQAHADQQPYMQGFMPVMEVYLAKTVGLAPSDIDTGNGIVLPSDADSIAAMAARAFAEAVRHRGRPHRSARRLRATPQGRLHPARPGTRAAALDSRLGGNDSEHGVAQWTSFP